MRALLAGLRHRSYVVYPEGSNTYGEEIGALRKGMLQLAFEERIPVFIVLKSGMASFRERQHDNVLGYVAHGTTDPAHFPDWRAFRGHIHASAFELKSVNEPPASVSARAAGLVLRAMAENTDQAKAADHRCVRSFVMNQSRHAVPARVSARSRRDHCVPQRA